MKCLDKKRIKMKGGETLALNERIMLSSVSTGVSICLSARFRPRPVSQFHVQFISPVGIACLLMFFLNFCCCGGSSSDSRSCSGSELSD